MLTEQRFSQVNDGKRAKLFVAALNLILLAYHGKVVGELVHSPSSDDLIFVANEYDSARGDSQITVAGTSVGVLDKMSHRPTDLLHRLKYLKTKHWTRDPDVYHLPWRDIWHCWDPSGLRLNEAVFPEFDKPSLFRPC